MRRTTLILGLVLTFTLQADETLRDDALCRRPENSPSLTEIENLYFSLADLALEDQRQQMWALSSRTRAALWTYNAERYLRSHPELDIEAQEMIRRGVALINTPGWFEIQEGSIGYPAKQNALGDFKRDFASVLSREVIYEVLIRLGPEPATAEDGAPDRGVASASPLKAPTPGSRPFSIQPNGLFDCWCGSSFDCGSSDSYDCYKGWCTKKIHCGPYADDPCWGKCKETGA